MYVVSFKIILIGFDTFFHFLFSTLQHMACTLRHCLQRFGNGFYTLQKRFLKILYPFLCCHFITIYHYLYFLGHVFYWFLYRHETNFFISSEILYLQWFKNCSSVVWDISGIHFLVASSDSSEIFEWFLYLQQWSSIISS